MAQRILPGAYVSLNDLSQLPEGQTALTVGYVLQANRGPVNEATLVTSPTDFLTKFTFSGKPAINDDPTFFEILKVLAQTNSMYISRAANTPLYGGIVFKKESSSAPAVALTDSIASPSAYSFDEANDLFLITGINPGAYNGEMTFEILSATDKPNELVYHIGADLGTGTACTFDTMQLTIRNANTNEVLETFLFSRDPEAKTIDGTSLYIEDVLAGSAYVKVRNNTTTATIFELPKSTTAPIQSGAGSNGSAVDASTLVAALTPFTSKNVPLSILGCGCSTQAEDKTFQQALLSVATTRQDCVAFVPSRKSDENATLSSTRAQNIVSYKKNDLASSSFYATMYAPHVKTTDIYNNRQATISACGPAIAGWLNVVNSLGYPYAYAGPQNGLVTGVTCDWKIGDESGEAQLMNDASINYIAFDGKVGRYYMQCQNTLQVANSSMRNLGTVLNVLDIKEHFVTSLKEYLQLPITTSLRRDIVNTATDYLDPMVGVRFSNYAFQDVSSDNDIADNTLRYLLTVSPTPYAQKIYLVMNIVNSAFNFSILQSL